MVTGTIKTKVKEMSKLIVLIVYVVESMYIDIYWIPACMTTYNIRAKTNKSKIPSSSAELNTFLTVFFCISL